VDHDWLGLLREQTDAFADLVARGDLDAPVVHCPGWSLHDLADHLGGVHQWAANAVITSDPAFDPEPAPAERAALVDWYLGHAAHLVDVLSRPADSPAWTMDGRNPTVGFWRRRQVHETAIHAWDAARASGRPSVIEPALAWDGVLEVVDVLYPRQVRLGRITPVPTAVRLEPTDVAGGTTIGSGPAVDVRHEAEVLLRVLWHRVDPATDRVDAEVVALLATAVTP
jgi:uncharacterized protein (TIGR03083 family)